MKIQQLLSVVLISCLYVTINAKNDKGAKGGRPQAHKHKPEQVIPDAIEPSLHALDKNIGLINKLLSKVKGSNLHPDNGDGDDKRSINDEARSNGNAPAPPTDNKLMDSEYDLGNKTRRGQNEPSVGPPAPVVKTISEEEQLMYELRKGHFKMTRGMTEDDLVFKIKEDVARRKATEEKREVELEQDRYSRAIPSWWPRCQGVDPDENLATSHPFGVLREGVATSNSSCDFVRPITDDVRNDPHFPINGFYTQYTEAYGIYVIGSPTVKPESLSRACYIVKMFFACRYDVRNAFYKNFGRIALIGDPEEQTSLPEYRTWDPVWNSRVRGLGPTMTIPLVSCGCDNQRCKPGDRYYDQDICIHELAHGVHVLAAQYVIENFAERLRNCYETNKPKWAGTYAAENMNEYFAVAAQFYWDSFRGDSYAHLGVVDRTSLRAYDADITALLDEVWPCASYYVSNAMIQRCEWKSCSIETNWFLLFPALAVKARSMCQEVAARSGLTVAECAEYACYNEANIFNFKTNWCQVVKCPSTAVQDLSISQSDGAYDIYSISEGMMPVMTVSETAQIPKAHCNRGPSSAQCAIPEEDRRECAGESNLSKQMCKRAGCCWNGYADDFKCYYSNQECADKHLMCASMSLEGECERNAHFMNVMCPLACNKCDEIKSGAINPVDEVNFCGDWHVWCRDWVETGECTTNSAWMNGNCGLGCGICTV